MKKRLFITGASGFLGWNICQIASSDWEVYGLCNRHPISLPAVVQIKADLKDYKKIKELFQAAKPDAVIHTAAASSPDACQRNPQGTYPVNVAASGSLAGLCADAAIPLVYTSSDLVFDGANAPYDENALPAPANIYGEQKLAAEREIRRRHPKSVICRMPLMFGYSGSSHQTFMHAMIKRIKAKQPVHLFDDEFRTPVDAKSAARGLLLALDFQFPVIHLGGKRRFSRYEMGVRLETVLGVHRSRIIPVSQRTMPPGSAPRPADVSLDSRKAFSTGYDPADFEAALLSMLQQSGSLTP